MEPTPQPGSGMLGLALIERERKRKEEEALNPPPRYIAPPKPENEALTAYNTVQHLTDSESQIEKCRIGMALALQNGRISDYKSLLELQSKLTGNLTDRVIEKQTERLVEKVSVYDFNKLSTAELTLLRKALA